MPIKTNVTEQGAGRDKFKRSVALLSRGYTSPGSFPDGMLTVYPWTSKTDEFLIERSRKGKKDTILYDLFAGLCDLNGCPTARFVAGEVALVLLVARSISRQNRLQFETRCTRCGNRHMDEITIPDQLERLGEKPEDYPGYDTVVLPVSRDEVALHPLLVQDEIDLGKREYKQVGDIEARVLAGVVSVGGGKPDSIPELLNWYNSLHPADTEFLRVQQDLLTPHLNQELTIECEECGENFKHTIQMDENFFRPPSRA